MTRSEHIDSCSVCSNQDANPNNEIICGFTGALDNNESYSDSNGREDNLAAYQADDIIETAPVTEGTVILTQEQIDAYRLEQNLNFAIITGILTSIIGGLVWALITVATGYQIGYMAVGIGALVGFGIRYAGRGIDPIYSYLGAGFALFGCLLGNFLTVVGYGAQELNISWFEVLNAVEFSLLLEIMGDSFSPIDLLFYGIAVYEGYRFAPRVFQSAS